MIVEKKELVEAYKTIRTKFCDICGDEIIIGLACSKAVCSCCGKDLCEKCIGDEIDMGGDSRIVYCEKCYTIYKKYEVEIKKHHDEVDRLYQECRAECNKT